MCALEADGLAAIGQVMAPLEALGGQLVALQFHRLVGRLLEQPATDTTMLIVKPTIS